MISKKNFLLFFLLLTFISCNDIIQKIDQSDHDNQIALKGDHFSLIFSNNIDGETHPCGCRQFPLGGLPQVAGLLYKEATTAPTIYVDTGDTFFPSAKIPEFAKDSLPFTAKNLGIALGKLKLRYFVPGENDFAKGALFLKEIAAQNNFKILVSNIKDKKTLMAEHWDTIKFNETIYAFIGYLDSGLIQDQKISALFEPGFSSIKKSIKEIKEKYKDKNIKFILLSHSGLTTDQKIAKDIPELDWIIGSHTQSFLRDTDDVGKTRIAQVLSRNHYLGKIAFFTDPNKKEVYSLLESREETKDLYPNNPLTPWLHTYKEELTKIQENEQKYLMSADTGEKEKLPSVSSCLQCHGEQVKFWEGTAHSLSYETLKKSKANFNRECIACHTVGFNQEEGFIHPSKVVQFEDAEKEKDEKFRESYFKEVSESIKIKGSIRRASKKERLEARKSWDKIDEKYKVKHNFANVQCLNCHNQTGEHPFEFDKPQKITDYSNTCIKCHSRDQSPDWYNKDKNGIATDLNKVYFSQKLKEVSCPKFKI